MTTSIIISYRRQLKKYCFLPFWQKTFLRVFFLIEKKANDRASSAWFDKQEEQGRSRVGTLLVCWWDRSLTVYTPHQEHQIID